MNSSTDLTSLIWLQDNDILKNISTPAAQGVTTSGGVTVGVSGTKHFINVITSGTAIPGKPSILMFKPHPGLTTLQPTELTQLIATSAANAVPHRQTEEIKYIEMKDTSSLYSTEDSSTVSSTLHVQVSPSQHLNHSHNNGTTPHHHHPHYRTGGGSASPPTPTKLSPPQHHSSSSSSSCVSSGTSSSSSSPRGVPAVAQGGALPSHHQHQVVPNPLSAYKKPPFSYSQLVFMSIENSTEKALPLREIYSWIEKYFPYYKNAPTGWKNSIRHELSYKNYFKKVTTTTKFIKGAWSVDKVYRPKLYTKLKSFLNCDEKLNYNLHKCLCETVSKYDLFSFINNNNDDEINAASIIMELKNQAGTPGTPGKEGRPEKVSYPLRAAKQTKRKHAAQEKASKNNTAANNNNNNHMMSNLNTQVSAILAESDLYNNNIDDASLTHIKFYEMSSPHKRIKVEPVGEMEGEEQVVNIKIEDPSPEHMAYEGYDPTSEIVVKEEEDGVVEYDGTIVASEVVYQEDVTEEVIELHDRVKQELNDRTEDGYFSERDCNSHRVPSHETSYASNSSRESYGTKDGDPYGTSIIRDPYAEIQHAYGGEDCEEEEEEKRKRDGAACALLHLAGLSSVDSSATKSNALHKSKNTTKNTSSGGGPGRRKLKVLKSANSNSGTSSSVSNHHTPVKKNNSWTLLTYPELFACNTSSSSSKPVNIER
uniref:Forkhead box protein N2 n=1 Tax=Cacopsylla melanoneura TaxID=428564 RepID=A0A8D8Z1E7_9HEMI